MKSWSFPYLVAICFLSLPFSGNVYAQDRGLHNTSKKFSKKGDMKRSDFDDPKQIERTWNAAVVRMPLGAGRSKRTSFADLAAKFGDGATKFPTAIYLHGCSGIWPGTHRRIKFLADSGFLVIAPASLARTKYPMSCNPRTHEGGLYRPTLRMRQYDAGYAIERAKALPFVDAENVILIGLSQGGITTATFQARNENQSVRARIVEGWTCNAGWGEYKGINAPPSEPVLSLVGVKDPWFQNPWTKGHCGTYMDTENGSKSIVYKKGKLAKRHELLEFKHVQNEVLTFLRAHVALPMSVKEIQRLLAKLGFDPGPADGSWGSKTLQALNKLREKHGMKPVQSLEASSQKLLNKLKGS